MLANAEEADVENILQNATPFQSRQGSFKYYSSFSLIPIVTSLNSVASDADNSIRSFWVSGGLKGLTFKEAAGAIVKEARDVLQRDLGVQIDWTSSKGALAPAGIGLPSFWNIQ